MRIKKIAEDQSGNNNNVPQNLNEAQTKGYKHYQQHGQYYYNNQYGHQASNENIGLYNHNYKE